MGIFALPAELLAQVLSNLHPVDLVHLGQTCHIAQEATRPSNSLLWHAAFLHVFDDPQQSWDLLPPSRRSQLVPNDKQTLYWHRELSRRMNALRAIIPDTSSSADYYGVSPDEAIKAVLDIIDTAKSSPSEAEIARGDHPQVDDRRSQNLQLLTSVREPWIRMESLIHNYHVRGEQDVDMSHGRPVTRSVSYAKRLGQRSEAASRLHVLYGRTYRERHEHGARGAARRIVYNWNNSVPENEYGPFKTDDPGEIDWKMLEAVASVMLRHFEVGADGRVAMPQGFCYAIPCRTLVDPSIPHDWAKVTGSWIGTYSFLDYADLFSFNTDNDPRWTLEDIPETHGDLMILDLTIDMSLKGDPRLKTSLPQCEDVPTLYFNGISRNFDSNRLPRLLITVMGCASLCKNGKEVRWRYIISYRGQEQWQLEGVQPGGIRSGPVYGVWTQWGHEEHSPVGSFLYVPEELCKKQELVLAR